MKLLVASMALAIASLTSSLMVTTLRQTIHANSLHADFNQIGGRSHANAFLNHT